MWKLVRRITTNFLGPIILWYTKQDRIYGYEGTSILVKKGVFHPGFFLSTKFLLRVIKNYPFKNKTVLELGAGSGLISFFLATKKAVVTATDISTVAIEGLYLNNSRLHSNITIIKSDLFGQIPTQQFDYIIINPPYYPKDPQNEEERAWFCGQDHQYFIHLFAQIGPYTQQSTTILMSLSEDCYINQIMAIAESNNFFLTLIKKKRIMGELNFIYQIIKK